MEKWRHRTPPRYAAFTDSCRHQLWAIAPAKIVDPLNPKNEVATFHETLPQGATFLIMKGEGGDKPFDNTEVFRVPAGHLFALGDNRDNSVDSRHPSPRYGVGFVPLELVIGRVIATF